MSANQYIKQSLLGFAMVCRARDSGRVSLTFDDGPDPETTPRLLEILAKTGQKATFFVLGRRALDHPDLIEAMREGGHEIANHSMTHCEFAELNWSGLAPEVDAVAALTVGGRPLTDSDLFRPPKGYIGPTLLAYCLAKRHRVVLWSLDSRDFEAPSAEVIIETVTRRHKPRGGDIVLMHDRVPNTIAALPAVIEDLNARGLASVSVSDLLGRAPSAARR